MPKDEPLSTKDLFLLLAGLCKLKAPPATAGSGKDYFLDKKSLRESDWNLAWLLSPEYAWSQVPYRD